MKVQQQKKYATMHNGIRYRNYILMRIYDGVHTGISRVYREPSPMLNIETFCMCTVMWFPPTHPLRDNQGLATSLGPSRLPWQPLLRKGGFCKKHVEPFSLNAHFFNKKVSIFRRSCSFVCRYAWLPICTLTSSHGYCELKQRMAGHAHIPLLRKHAQEE